MPIRSSPWRAVVGNLVLVLLFLACVIGVAAVLRAEPEPRAVTGQTTRAGQDRLLLISGGSLNHALGTAIASANGWVADVVVHPESGFARTWRKEGTPLAMAVRVDATALRSAGTPGLSGVDVVLVQGGEADNATPSRELQVAAAHMVDWLVDYRAAGTTVVLGGPIPSGAVVPASLVRVNDALRAVALNRGVPYVDGIAAGWSLADPALAVKIANQLSALRGR